MLVIKYLQVCVVWQVRFFITVKKNYRSVAYHNWSHGFHVANSIYSILKASTGIFRPLEVGNHTSSLKVAVSRDFLAFFS